jgi:hypothetical protein
MLAEAGSMSATRAENREKTNRGKHGEEESWEPEGEQYLPLDVARRDFQAAIAKTEVSQIQGF